MLTEHELPSARPTSDGLFYYEGAASAADAVFEAELSQDLPPGLEPADKDAAAAALRRLSERFADLPAAIRQALRGAESNAAQLSEDRLQGLAEIIQNADDVAATEVRFQVRTEGLDGALLASHDGNPILLRDVMGLATPWLSLKSSNASATGRFGIGLMTLRSLSDTLDVHCGCFHIRLGSQTLTPLDVDIPTSESLGGHGWTVFRIPLDRGNIGVDDVRRWVRQWGDAALMFLSSVRTVTLIDEAGHALERLHLSVQTQTDISMPFGRIERRIVTARDQRRWAVYSRDAPTSADAHRAEKARKNTTPVAVAFPLGHAESGWVHVGLPIRPLGLPFRISGQFDPLANRRDLADTEWNGMLTEPLSTLWLESTLDMFNERPKLAWALVPRASDLGRDERTSGRFRAALNTNLMLDARIALAHAVRFKVSEDLDGDGRLGLDRLAVEHPALTAVLSAQDVVRLSGADAALPGDARDDNGIWRTVLDELALLGGPTPIAVTIRDAMPLFEDTSRPAAFVADLTAAALSAELSETLTQLPCIVLADGSHIKPPTPHSAFALMEGSGHPIWESLSMGAHVHADYVNRAAWSAVLQWLTDGGRLLSDPNAGEALERLAEAGRSGNELLRPLTDRQAEAIRAALEQANDTDRTRWGPGIGQAVRLDATSYDGNGQRVASHERLCDTYIIERDSDSWSVAAGKTPGLTWLHRRYARDLRASTGRTGLGPQRLFKLLGAETAPRLRSHPSAERRYASGPPGVPLSAAGSPDIRRAQMRRLGATFTTNDNDSPDLQAVLRNIASDKTAKNRRRRAAAVIGSLARAWDRLGDCQYANAVDTDYGWLPKGEILAWWLLEASDTPWLTNGRGAARSPAELRLRTPGTLAVYGNDPSKFLAGDIDAPNRRPVLQALGVAGDPPASEFIRSLEQLRDETLEEPGRAVLDRAAPLYQALTEQIGWVGGSPRIGDLAVSAASSVFARDHGLVITNVGWRRPSMVLSGPPIFGDLRPFVPAVAGTERLWQLLGIREPGFPAAREVIQELSRKRTAPSAERQLIMLETLRLMAAQVNLPEASNTKLNRLPLWTSQGWLSRRPVYAVIDPQVGRALANFVPVWEPGGDLAQFASLLESLGVTCLEPSAASVVNSASATIDKAATALFNQALRLLQEDLSLNDPNVESSALVPWDQLATYRVAVLPDLAVTIAGTHVRPDPTVQVAALVDRDSCTMFIDHFDAIGRVGSGGRAVASLFATDQRRLAQAWHAAWDSAEEGRDTRVITLASRRAEEEAAHRQEANTARLHKLAGDAKATRKVHTGSAGKESGAGTERHGHAVKVRPTRNLVDAREMELVNSEGEVIPERRPASGDSGGHAAGRTKGPDLKRPDTNRSKNSGGGVHGPTNYTAEERESVGMALVMHALASDVTEISDIRDQRNVGADAVDQLKRFFELKVHAGPIPDEVRLTDSEVQRALSTTDFFLVVVGNVERGEGQPEIRIITDPLNQLRVEAAGMIRLSGISRAQSLVYRFRTRDAEGD